MLAGERLEGRQLTAGQEVGALPEVECRGADTNDEARARRGRLCFKLLKCSVGFTSVLRDLHASSFEPSVMEERLEKAGAEYFELELELELQCSRMGCAYKRECADMRRQLEDMEKQWAARFLEACGAVFRGEEIDNCMTV